MGDERTNADRLRSAAVELEARFAAELLEDDNTDSELRTWLDGDEDPLPWANPDRVTSDEWFFITTLYGEMTLDGQRTHIRKYFPSLFVEGAARDGHPRFRSRHARLRGAAIWVDEDPTCQDGRDPEGSRSHHGRLHGSAPIDREGEHSAQPGNAFPIDTRVEKELKRHGLPIDERQFLGLSLEIGRDPRKLARMFYTAGGEGA